MFDIKNIYKTYMADIYSFNVGVYDSAIYTLPGGGAATIALTVSGNVGSGPEIRRKVQLGYI